MSEKQENILQEETKASEQEHCHEHHHDGHSHEHHHDHEHSGDELLALLAYMVKHNKHHEEELAELNASLTGEAAELIAAAIADFHTGNDRLEAALALLNR